MDPGGPLLRFTPSRRDPLKPGVSRSLVVLHDSSRRWLPLCWPLDHLPHCPFTPTGST